MDGEAGRAGRDGPSAREAFAAALFAEVPPEDSSPVPPATREELAAAAYGFLSEPRSGGEPAIRLADVSVERDGTVRDATVLEAVNDDRPYLLDSTLAALGRHGLEATLVAHPILRVDRGPDGAFRGLGGSGDGPRESLLHIHLERLDDADRREALLADLRLAYRDVAAVAADAAMMRRRLGELAAEYRANPPPGPTEERAEALAFLDWLDERRFVLLGMRAARVPEREGDPEPLEGSGLGLLRDATVPVLKRGGELALITPEIRAFLERPEILIVTKASVRSRVHRAAYLDYVGAKLFSPSGRLWGELAIVGLWTPAAFATPAAATPYLRRKVEAVVARAGYDPTSFAGRTLLDILEAYPRDELFQIDEDALLAFSRELLRLSEHPRVRALPRVDRFDRFVSVIVFVPKDRYDTDVRRRIGAFLAETYGGRLSASYPAYPDGPLARTHFIVGRDGTPTPAVAPATLEAGIQAIARTWADGLADALARTVGGPRARALAARYARAFGPAYRDAFAPEAALADIDRLERLSDARPRAVDFHAPEGESPARVNLKLFTRGEGAPLSQRVPLLERMGLRVLDERTYRIAPDGGGASATLHDMALERASGLPFDVAAHSDRMEAALLAVFRGVAEEDGFNKLVLEAGLGWREAAALRALGRYLRQIAIPYSQDYLADVLARHGPIAAAIVGLLRARFDPAIEAAARPDLEAEKAAAVETLLADVRSLDEDRILRRFQNLVRSAVRTNFFQLGPDGLPVTTIAFKLECARVEGLPRPRPLYEIHLNGPRVEGTHLRFGKVARGGLRWSDRPQDFRTEVLGLVKAQQVKNAVIVPVGAKGGFFPKRLPPPTDRAAWLAEGTEAYRLFVDTLLDLTDDLEGDAVRPPADTVRHDGDDPYLVVAADKGTATFSDLANGISAAHGFWLGDAFASGGSVGYDHKAMGITARGAWEAVKRHFREIDVDIQSAPVTVAGVGDMSGDVFGNGLLLSKTLKLVAAFDHRDIFLDPDPDPAASWTERKRLFDLPRSSWADYDKGLISPGGGVHPRASKSIPLTPEVRASLGVEAEAMTPAELMSAILRAPVGLLFFGGIGTYVRAADETDAAVGDRANDAVRVAGADLRATVVGEGANLGMTQRGRIEAARRGVRLNTDAIDNSAGVNTSDVEVNVKIALAAPARDGRLSAEDRRALLAAMTDEVAALVLRNNYLQTLAISLAQRRGAADVGFAGRLMGVLEGAGRLDRALEFLPDDAALAARAQAGEGLTRPELAVLLAYAKLALHDELLASSVPDDPYLGRELDRYFPTALRERFPDAVAGHRLRREIVATQLANAIVNRGGPAVVTRLVDETGADAATVAAAYAATRDSYGLAGLNAAIDGLDGRVAGEKQLALYAAVQDLTLSRMVWFIRFVDFRARGLDDVVGQYAAGIAAVREAFPSAAGAERVAALDARAAALGAEGVPPDLARRVAELPDLAAAPDVTLVAARTGRPIAEVAAVHFALDGLFGLGALAAAAAAIPTPEHYDRLARDRAIDALAAAHRRLAAEVLGRGGAGALDGWRDARGGEVERIRAAVAAVAGSGLTVSKLTVAASLLGDLAKE